MKNKIALGLQPSAWTSDYWTEEKRKVKSEEKKEFYELNPEAHPNRKLAGNRNKMTYPETVAYDWFIENNIEVELQKKIKTYFVDFCYNNIIIEIDGERWRPIGNEKDVIRDNELSELGYIIYRIRSKERIKERLQEIFFLRC